jgi:hypothetical protein
MIAEIVAGIAVYAVFCLGILIGYSWGKQCSS